MVIDQVHLCSIGGTEYSRAELTIAVGFPEQAVTVAGELDSGAVWMDIEHNKTASRAEHSVNLPRETLDALRMGHVDEHKTAYGRVHALVGQER